MNLKCNIDLMNRKLQLIISNLSIMLIPQIVNSLTASNYQKRSFSEAIIAIAIPQVTAIAAQQIIFFWRELFGFLIFYQVLCFLLLYFLPFLQYFAQ